MISKVQKVSQSLTKTLGILVFLVVINYLHYYIDKK